MALDLTTLSLPNGPVCPMGVHNNLLSEVSLPYDHYPDTMNVFRDEAPSITITNQLHSGRCWLFAALNVVRSLFISKHKLPTSFEFSQKHLQFYDLLEKSNHFLHLCEKYRNDPLDSRKMMFFLNKPIEDGGQWQMFVSLIKKYGMVPKANYPDTKHATNTRGMDDVIKRLLRGYCRDIRNNPNHGPEQRKEMMNTIYGVLVKMLGLPVQEFVWEYKDKSDNYVNKGTFTPLSFYELVKEDFNPDDYVSLMNDPRRPYGCRLEVEDLQNVVGGEQVIHTNVDMDTMASVARKSISGGDRVWFGSEVSKYHRSQSAMLDRNVFAMEKVLGVEFTLSKEEMLRYGDGLITHAMCLVGHHGDSRWKIENSWGKKGTYDGYLIASNDWFNENVYQIVVHKKYLNECSDGEIHVLPPWDPLGSLA